MLYSRRNITIYVNETEVGSLFKTILFMYSSIKKREKGKLIPLRIRYKTNTLRKGDRYMDVPFVGPNI